MDLCKLARRDHEELDMALSAMVEPHVAPRDLSGHMDVFRLGLAVHVVAEARVHATLVSLVRPPPPLRLEISALRREHAVQQSAADRLVTLTPGTDEWYCCALELRVLVLDHARRQDYLRSALEAHVPTAIGRGLVAQYATERMTLLGSTSPLTLARAVYAA